MIEANSRTRGMAVHRLRGFSLAEVLIATALMAVILLALFGLITSGVRRAYGGKKMTQATTIAQSVLEQANGVAPYTTVAAATTDTSAVLNFSKVNATITKTAIFSGTAATFPSSTTLTAWETLMVNADLPTDASHPAVLTVTETPQPSGNFGNAPMTRIIVDLTWWEWGTRRRQVRLQTLNVRTTTPSYF